MTDNAAEEQPERTELPTEVTEELLKPPHGYDAKA